MTDLRQVFDDLVRFETVLWATIDERLQGAAGLTLANLNALLVIDATPSCRVLDVAEALSITVGGASQAVDRLEKAGWCVRRAHPTDRRSSVLALTDDGRAILGTAAPVFDVELRRLLRDPLDGPGLARLADSLGALRRAATRGKASAG